MNYLLLNFILKRSNSEPPSHPHGPKTEEGELNRIIFTETAFRLLSLNRMKFRYLWYENLNFQIANLYMKNVFVHLFI